MVISLTVVETCVITFTVIEFDTCAFREYIFKSPQKWPKMKHTSLEQ